MPTKKNNHCFEMPRQILYDKVPGYFERNLDKN